MKETLRLTTTLHSKSGAENVLTCRLKNTQVDSNSVSVATGKSLELVNLSLWLISSPGELAHVDRSEDGSA